MPTSSNALRTGLYREHLEEVSALYDQRVALHRDREVSWFALADFEARIDAHLDALVRGGDLSAAVCRARAADGDAGELFAALCVFCRRMHAAAFAEVLQQIDYADGAKTRALRDALKYELPAEWRDQCSRALATGNRRVVPILAQVLAYRRLTTTSTLTTVLRDATTAELGSLLWSVARAPGADALPLIRGFLTADDRPTAAAAVYAALRLGDRQVRNTVMASAADTGAGVMPLGLAGGPREAPVLISLLSDPDRASESVVALGLLGDLSTVKALIGALSSEPLAAAAAEALQVITGAPLMEEVIVAEETSEDEMLPDEVAAFRDSGEAPKRSDGEPFGTRVRRVTQDPARWQEWLRTNSAQFARGQRYRFGRTCTPRVLLDCLRSGLFPKSYRPWVADELLIRYNIDLPLEADMFVAEQLRILTAAAAEIDAVTASVEPGRWYFAGQEIF